MVLPDRIELSTSPLPRECSTTELRQLRPIYSRFLAICPVAKGSRQSAVAKGRRGRQSFSGVKPAGQDSMPARLYFSAAGFGRFARRIFAAADRPINKSKLKSNPFVSVVGRPRRGLPSPRHWCTSGSTKGVPPDTRETAESVPTPRGNCQPCFIVLEYRGRIPEAVSCRPIGRLKKPLTRRRDMRSDGLSESNSLHTIIFQNLCRNVLQS